MEYKRYKKEFTYSYTLGAFPTLELLLSKPEKVLAVYYSDKAIRSSQSFIRIQTLCTSHGINLVRNDKQINALESKGSTMFVGVFTKFTQELCQNENSILLVNPSDMGNLGTIMRTACGMGVANIALIQPAVDIFDPKVVRGSMGAIFKVSFKYFVSLKDYKEKHNNHLYLFDIKGKQYVDKVKFSHPSTLVFGNEGKGLPDEYLQYGEVVRIKQNSKIDSLNLSIAVGIGLYELTT